MGSVGYKQIGFKAMAAWAKTGGVGIFISILTFIISIVMLWNKESKTWPGILLISSIIFSLIYVLIANKHALNTLLYQLWKNKLAYFIIPKVDSYVIKFSNLQPGWFQNLTTAASIKTKLLDELRKDKAVNKVQRIVLNYGFEKLKLSKMDFQQPEDAFKSLLIQQVRDKIDIFKRAPSCPIFWLIVSLQIILTILTVIMN